MASITTFSRLEPQPRRGDLAVGSAAPVQDPLWLLARQWQVGEFAGHDGGNPIVARWRGVAAPPTRFVAGPIPPDTVLRRPALRCRRGAAGSGHRARHHAAGARDGQSRGTAPGHRRGPAFPRAPRAAADGAGLSRRCPGSLRSRAVVRRAAGGARPGHRCLCQAARRPQSRRSPVACRTRRSRRAPARPRHRPAGRRRSCAGIGGLAGVAGDAVRLCRFRSAVLAAGPVRIHRLDGRQTLGGRFRRDHADCAPLRPRLDRLVRVRRERRGKSRHPPRRGRGGRHAHRRPGSGDRTRPARPAVLGVRGRPPKRRGDPACEYGPGPGAARRDAGRLRQRLVRHRDRPAGRPAGRSRPR